MNKLLFRSSFRFVKTEFLKTMANFSDTSNSWDLSSRKKETSEERSNRHRHPKSLKGKEIGLWYARRRREKEEALLLNDMENYNVDPSEAGTSQGKSKQPKSEDYEKIRQQKRDRREEMQALLEQRHRSVVKMGVRKEKHIENLLEELKSANISPFDSSSDSSNDSFMDWINSEWVATEYEAKYGSTFRENNPFKRPSSSETNRLKTNDFMNEQYLLELKNKGKDSNYVSMLDFRKKLPIYNMRQEIVDLIESNQVVVLKGETGCGKTTQVPQFVLDSNIANLKGSLCRIVCTQPRRISATSVAERVAQERAETCGNSSVGYQIRLEKKLPRRNASILYCTTGIMLQWLHFNPELVGISHIILDEIHERTLESDFLLIILKDLLAKRPDLKLVLMSATLNAEMFSKYFHNCPMLNVPGFTYPVKEYTLEDVLEMTGYCLPESKPSASMPKWRRYTRKGKQEIMDYEQVQEERRLFLGALQHKYSQHTIRALENYNEEVVDVELIVALIKYICRMEPGGAILVFLPGWEQISRCHNLLTSDSYFDPRYHLILPLHSLMPTVNQKEIFNQPPFGMQKIILSTNIAETSVTIDDIVYVIDSGKIKISNFDVTSNIATLKPEWIAKANAKQRRGRAGRTQPGVCYHLFTKSRQSKLLDYLPPEIMRIRLEELCLKIKILKLGDIKTFLEKAMEIPHIRALELSIELLKTLNAFDGHENLTPLGYHLAHLPLDAHTGKMILFGAMFSCLDPILTVAASLSFKDAFIIPLGKERQADRKRCELAGDSQSDHLMLIKAFSAWEKIPSESGKRDFCQEYFLSPSTLRMLSGLKKEFARHLHELHFLHCDYLKHPDFNMNSGNEALIKAIICAGLYPNVAKLRNTKAERRARRPPNMYTKENGKVGFHPKSINFHERNFKSQWLVYYQKIRSTETFIHDTTVVTPYPLLFFGGQIATSVENGIETVTVDDDIIFHCPKYVAHLVMGLRNELDKLLKHKISQPGVINWSRNHREGAVLRAIVDLITYEDYNIDQDEECNSASELSDTEFPR